MLWKLILQSFVEAKAQQKSFLNKQAILQFQVA
jgi:hypothetical protein